MIKSFKLSCISYKIRIYKDETKEKISPSFQGIKTQYIVLYLGSRLYSAVKGLKTAPFGQWELVYLYI